MPQVIRSFPWPKPMRWGEARRGRSTGCGRCNAMVATFGPETEEPEIVPFEIDGLEIG